MPTCCSPSHQTRSQADSLLDPEISDVDGNTERRTDTISVFNGTAPRIRLLDSEAEEIEAVAQGLRQWAGEGIRPDETGVFAISRLHHPIPRHSAS